MSIETRPASIADAKFIAWVIQEAARSHLERGIWDIMFPGPDAARLDFLAALTTTEAPHFAHVSRFRVAEVDGQPAAALSAYENSEFGMQSLVPNLVTAFAAVGRDPEELAEVLGLSASFEAIGYPSIDDVWIVEWVATHPDFRGRSLCHRLLEEILDAGRTLGFERAQIGYLLGNVRAKAAYERIGFEWVEDHCHADFDRDYGSPGIARMQREL